MKFLICVALLAVVPAVFSSSWSYHGGADGRDTWHLIPGSYCNGSAQSPIDINASYTTDIDLGLFQLDGYDAVNDNMDMDNNGHGVTVRLHEDVAELYKLSGGGLPANYTATQFHIHWGSINTQGSEHHIDGRPYAAELHMVHYDKTKYADLTEALTSLEWDACAVLGTLIEIGDDNNDAFDAFMDYIPEIANYSSGMTALGQGNLPSFSIRSVLPFDLSRFYRYNGSLTVPNCYESVIWTVFEDTVSISEAQLEMFRTVYGDHLDDDGNNEIIVDNHRLINDLNDRMLYHSAPQTNPISTSTPEPTDGGAVTISPISALFIIAFALSLLFNLF